MNIEREPTVTDFNKLAQRWERAARVVGILTFAIYEPLVLWLLCSGKLVQWYQRIFLK